MLEKNFSEFLKIFFLFITLLQNFQLINGKWKRIKKVRRRKINYLDIYNIRCINKNFINELNYKTKVIASFTSYKNRLETEDINNMIDSLLNQTIKPFKIVMTLYIEDIEYINNYFKSLINKNILELIITYQDIKPHKKYFYVMQKYREYPIITFDDDIIFENTTIESLVNSYIKYPNVISARRIHKMRFKKGHKLKPYKNWLFECNRELNPDLNLFATNGAGTLFPPNILNITNDLLHEVKKIINADDIYLKYLEIKKNIKTVYVPNNRPMGYHIQNQKVQEKALWKKNKKENDKYLKLFNISILMNK